MWQPLSQNQSLPLICAVSVELIDFEIFGVVFIHQISITVLSLFHSKKRTQFAFVYVPHISG